MMELAHLKRENGLVFAPPYANRLKYLINSKFRTKRNVYKIKQNNNDLFLINFIIL